LPGDLIPSNDAAAGKNGSGNICSSKAITLDGDFSFGFKTEAGKCESKEATNESKSWLGREEKRSGGNPFSVFKGDGDLKGSKAGGILAFPFPWKVSVGDGGTMVCFIPSSYVDGGGGVEKIILL
jgi:hypothetical protein